MRDARSVLSSSLREKLGSGGSGYLLCYFKEESESASGGVAPTSSTGKLTIVECQMDLDIDEYAPDDCRGLLGS